MLNWKRAVIAAGAAIAAILIAVMAVLVCIILTFELSFSGSWLSIEDQLLWLMILSTAASIGAALLTRALSSIRRAMVATVAAFVTTFVVVLLVLPEIYSVLTAFGIILLSALCVSISIVSSSQVSPVRMRIIFLVLTMSVLSGLTMITLDATNRVSLSVSLSIWVLLPTVAGLLRTVSNRPTR